MYYLLGDLHMENGDYKHAIHSFERAQAQMRNYLGPRLFAVSLVSFLRTIWQCVNNDQHF